jgi:uncharacterized membrane protein
VRVHRSNALATLLGITGTTHFLFPRPYARIVPRQLGKPYPYVYVSGAAELACAAGLLSKHTRRSAAWATATLFVVVFPANVQMALDAQRGPSWYRAVAYARLPLQLPLVWWAISVGRHART